MATHSNILAWETPWTVESDGNDNPIWKTAKETIVAFCSYLSLSHFPGPIAHSALVIDSLPAACVSFLSWALIDSKSNSTLLPMIGLNVACAQSCLTL